MDTAAAELKTVLVVDDDKVDRLIVREYIGKHYALLEAASGWARSARPASSRCF